MTLSERNLITERMSVILGANNVRIGRVVDLIWIAIKGTDGRDYALHMQTFFRFCNQEEILIADTDKYLPASPEMDYDTFNWDVQGNNLLDKWCEEFNENLSDKIIIGGEIGGKDTGIGGKRHSGRGGLPAARSVLCV